MVTRPLRPLGSDAWEFVWSQHLNGPGRPLLRVKLDTWVLGYFSTEDALGLGFTPNRMWASELASEWQFSARNRLGMRQTRSFEIEFRQSGL
jgi:hypothetical protein